MYISLSFLEYIFPHLKKIGPDRGKSRLERVSALRHFLAAAELIKNHGSINLNPENDNGFRSEFIDAVGHVVALKAHINYTPDFVVSVKSRDYKTGSNFLTTRLKNSDGAPIDYPGRPGPLLHLDKWNISIHENYLENLNTFYNLSQFRAPFSLWLLRNDQFRNDLLPSAPPPLDNIKELLLNRYDTHIAEIFTPSQDEYLSFLTDFTGEYLSSDIADVSELGLDLSDMNDAKAIGIDSDEDAEILENETIGENIILYGAPGTGKSYFIDKYISINNATVIRTVFHSDLQNSDFIGCLKPSLDAGHVTYSFSPGSFSLALSHALKTPNKHVLLIIEEINRAPSASVFGEIFLLLDRDKNGESEYYINFPTIEMQLWVEKEVGRSLPHLSIPRNLSIYATMNSADQGVYPLDTAFRRRWKQKYIPIDYTSAPQNLITIIDSEDTNRNISWPQFLQKLNTYLITTLSIPEDRLLGPWFVKPHEFIENADNIFIIPEKVLLYLWDDVLRHIGRENIFDMNNILCFGDIYSRTKNKKHIFTENFINHLFSNSR